MVFFKLIDYFKLKELIRLFWDSFETILSHNCLLSIVYFAFLGVSESRANPWRLKKRIDLSLEFCTVHVKKSVL